MNSIGQSLWRDVIITNELGLHARSAAKLAATARQASGRVWLTKETEKVDAKQVLDILTLAAAKGDKIRIRIESTADLDILEQMVQLINSGFGE